MRVLVLSCNTGEGHNSCAKSIKEVFDIRGETCVIEDALRFISDRTSRFISWGHVFVYRNLPWLFNWGYAFVEDHTGIFKEKKLLYTFFGRGADALCRFIISGNYDTVICVHPFASLMLTEAQRRYELPVKTAFVATDYTCSPSVKDSRLDYYFIPDERLATDFESPQIPKERIVASGIPIRQIFYHHTEKQEAKQALGIEPDHKHMVMMCGSMGCGPIEQLTGRLTEQLQEGFDLTVVCGTNEKRRAQLEQKYGGRKNLHICGFVEDMSLMLDSADLYLTKAGGISVTEAATKGVPMLFIRAVAGCEEYNSVFYTQLGGARSGRDVTELVQICTALVTEEHTYQAMTDALKENALRNHAECICTTLAGNTGNLS